MKTRLKLIPYFIYGFLLMGTLHLSLQCSKNDELFDAVNPRINEEKIDQIGMERAGKAVQDLFNNADQEGLKELMFSDQTQILNEYSDEELEIIAKAFKKRKISYYTDIYAEYSYTIDNVEYTLAMGKDCENNWKIIRF